MFSVLRAKVLGTMSSAPAVGSECLSGRRLNREGSRKTRAPGRKGARWITVAACSPLAACSLPNLNGDGSSPSADGTYVSELCESNATPIARERYGEWIAITLNDVIPGDEQYLCGDGDTPQPYKFFVQYNPSATNLTIAFEPGGACWDAETCSGQAGRLSTVRLDGVPNDLMTNVRGKPWAAMYPHFGRIDNSVPTNYYNHVFFPYCTGDAFTGGWDNNDPAQRDDEAFITKYGERSVRHHGRRNIEAATRWLAQTFPQGYLGQLLVLGSSAGAVGAAVNYPLLREALEPKCGAMVADSGPLFPGKGLDSNEPGPQAGVLARVREPWALTGEHSILKQLDAKFASIAPGLMTKNVGNVNRGLAELYPKDRFLLTAFKQDLDFSLFSFVASGVIPPGDDIAEEVIDLWNSELDDFQDWIHRQPGQNWGYYMPNFRHDWCSHMVATAGFTLADDPDFRSAAIGGHAQGYYRTEIGEQDFGDALRQVLDPSVPLPRIEARFDPNQLTYLSAPGVGVSNETWYQLGGGSIGDKQAYIDAERQRCVNTNGYPR